ncbi:hypothetical protein ACFW2D_29470 [Streptomyces sp. NPDC058914]|uniref:hypothetical protein n=1 Tax=Streptomyces TaxID=1883 RepID=UPI00367B7123
MNTERPDNDDTARGPEDRGTPEEARPEDAVEAGTGDEQGGAAEETSTEDGPAEPAATAGAERLEAPAEVKQPSAEVEQPAAEAETPAAEAEEPAAEAEVEQPAAEAGTPAAEAEQPVAEAEEPVVAREAGTPATGPAGDEVRGDGSVDHDEPSAASRRRSSVLVASVAAAVLLVGGGGAYLASTAGDSGGGSGSGASPGDGTPPVLVLDGYAGSPSGGATNGIAPGEPNPYGVVYRAEGTLPDGPGSAPVYWAKGEVTKDEVARLAAALGVGGTPVTEGQDWKVGSGEDGSGPVLRVNKQAPGLWTFNRYAPGTDDCESATVCAKEPTAPAGDPVGEAAAKKAAAPVLKALGQDDAKIDASQVMGAQRIVNAEPEVGGLPTHGWTTGVTVNAQGEVAGGSGQLKAPVKGDSYPVLSAQETLDRMNAAPGTDHRAGIGGCAGPVPLEDGARSTCGGSTSVPQKTALTVEDAVFGLAPHASGGRQVLVPSWLFEVRGTADVHTVTHPAVEPEYLGSPGASTPSAEPSSGGRTSDVQVDGYTAEGRELTVSFTGGVCSTYKATAVESEDEVEVTVTATSDPDKVCILIAQVYHQTVQLDEPLGGRTVVGSDGREIPLEKPGARLP